MKDQKTTKLYAKSITLAVLLGMLILTPTMAQVTSAINISSSGTIVTILPLHVEGRNIKNAAGNNITLLGVNHAGFHDSPGGWFNTFEGWHPSEVEEHATSMVEWGINVVRFHTCIEWWLEDEVTYSGVYYPSYRQNIKDAIEIFAKHGIYVIFDGFCVLEHAGQDALPFPPYLTAEEEAVVPSQQAFVDWWISVATELKDYPNVMYELWNEPTGDADAKEAWLNVVEQCITGIREVSDQIIVVQWAYMTWVNLNYPGSITNDLQWVNDARVQGTNIVYSTHIYENSVHYSVPEYMNAYEYDDLKAGFQYMLMKEMVEEWDKPLIIGECGCRLDEGETGITRWENTLAIFNEWDLNYVAFWWRPDGIYRLLDSRTSRNPNVAGQILVNAIANATD